MSFAGTLTFKNAANLRAALAIAEPERVLVETDAPFLTPHPHRGRPNASYMVPYTVRAMAVTGHGPDAVHEVARNTQRVYGRGRTNRTVFPVAGNTDPGPDSGPPQVVPGISTVSRSCRFITLRLQWITISRGRGRPSDNFTSAGRLCKWTGPFVRVWRLQQVLPAHSGHRAVGVRRALGVCRSFPVPGWSKRLRAIVVKFFTRTVSSASSRSARSSSCSPRSCWASWPSLATTRRHPQRGRQSQFRPDLRRHRRPRSSRVPSWNCRSRQGLARRRLPCPDGSVINVNLAKAVKVSLDGAERRSTPPRATVEGLVTELGVASASEVSVPRTPSWPSPDPSCPSRRRRPQHRWRTARPPRPPPRRPPWPRCSRTPGHARCQRPALPARQRPVVNDMVIKVSRVDLARRPTPPSRSVRNAQPPRAPTVQGREEGHPGRCRRRAGQELQAGARGRPRSLPDPGVRDRSRPAGHRESHRRHQGKARSQAADNTGARPR